MPLLEIEHLHTIRDLPAYIEYLRANPETHPWPTCPAKLTGDDDHVSVMVARFEETLDASPTDVDPVSPAASTVEALVQRRAELAGIVNPLADIELVRAWVNSVRPLVRYGFPDFLADFERAAEEPTWPSRASTGTTLDRTLLAGQMHAHRLQDTAEGYRRGLLGVVDALLSIVDAVPRAAPAEHLRLLERIGGGAFADVWHGRDNRLDRDVAFKLIRASREIEASVENHARALAKVNHPNVVTVHGVENVIVPDTGLVMRAIVMEFLDGQSLQARIDAGPAFTRAEAKAICTAIIEGVQAIHDVGLAHNDLHPGNIVVARAQTKVIDVLHRDASSLLTTGTMAHRFRTDCRAVRDLVRIVVEHSEMPPQVLAPLDSLGWEASLDAVRAAFGVVFAEAAPAPVTNEGGLPDFRVRVTVAVVGLDTGPAKQLSIEGQNFDSSAVFVSAAGFELADGRRLALTRDAATRAPLVGREVKPGDSMTVMFDPGAVIDELELDQVGAAFFRDKLGRVFRSTADAVQAALSPWRT